MRKEECLEKIEEKLSKFFDIERIYHYKKLEFDLFAKSHVRNEKYFASKKVTVYAFENNEYNFTKIYKELDQRQLEEFTEHLKAAAGDFVEPDREHMSSIVTGVIITENPLDEKLKKDVRKFKFMKSFSLGFKGWVYVRLIVIDLQRKEVTTNKRGDEVKKFYQM